MKRYLTMMSGGIWFIDPPQDISLDGYRIDNVIQYTDFVITLYFGIVVVALTFFVWKYHAGKNPQAVYDHGDTKKHRYLTIAMGLLVFLSVDVVIESMSFKDLKEAFWNFPKNENVLRIEVMPQQYAWNFRYAGEDGQFGTADDIVPPQNILHIPVNTPVVVQLTTYDVIHSFYLPNFRVKQDATPGMVTALWFQATETGSFEIACAELCGNSHFKMKGYLTVESEEKFNAWLSAEELEGTEDEWDDWGDVEEDVEGVPTQWGWPWKEIK
ncbi:uncharacterized protein METZ01_LOCUS42657 [marine metagenome]|uniref:cytochrome-c oxidase n=1 Tax=marine metagenome TaxID=408172 RepID=A0A381RL89_9ZZZZ